MTYEETIHYLFNRLPMFSRIGAAAYKKDLTNTIELCNYINNPQQHFKSVHIAGTNGKGSTSHMLAAILQMAGYKVGLYTSPHLHDFRERFRINGEMIDKDFVIDFTQRIQPAIDKTEPSFFEITVAMAFDYFALHKVDIAIIETGLGGRLDSTNIITPELSIITNIGMDHMNLLGDTPEEIAMEKAGIIKPGVPVIVGETWLKVRKVFEDTARERQAPLVFADHLRYVADWNYEHHQLAVQVAHPADDSRTDYVLDLPGYYQTKNLVTVLEAVHQLKQLGWHIPEEAVHAGLKQVKKLTGLHGRWEVIRHNPAVIMDVGHNEDGIRQIVSQIELTNHKHLHIIIGMVKDKEIDKALAQLPREATYYFTQAQIPRALPADELAAKGAQYDLTGNTYAEVNAALQTALQRAQRDDLILVCGSVFLVGEVKV